MKQFTICANVANRFFKVLQGYTKGIRFVAVLTVLLTMGIGQAWGETYTKVTSAPADWSGEYIIVYESNNTAHVWTGVDAAKCNTTADISSNSVTGDFITVTIAPMTGGYSIKVNGGTNSGKYIYGTSGSNKLNFGTTAQLNTLSYEAANWVKITSNTSVLTFNDAANDMRFRYYKSASYSNMKKIQLYKKKSAAYTLHYGIDGQSNWKSEEFEEVGNNNEMQISNFTIPSTTHYYVGKPGYNDNYGNRGQVDGPNSQTTTWDDMYLAMSLQSDNANGSPKLGQATGAVGTIRIYSNSTWNNKQAAFIPNGYKLKFGTTEYAFTHQSNGEYHSDIVQYNTTSARYNVSAGVINGSNGYVATNNTQEMQHIFLNTGGTNLWGKDNVTNFGLYDITNSQFTCLMVKVPGEDNLYEGWVPSNCTKVIFVRLSNSTPSWDNKYNQTGDVSLENNKNLFTITQWDNQTSGWSAYTQKGKFRMNDNYKDKNWYVRFYPHYVVTYNANGGDGTMAEQAVPADNANVKIAANTFTRTGYTFNGWKTQANGGSSYTAGTSYTITSDLTLHAQWKANTYTITLDGNNGSGHTTSVTATYNSATLSPSTITNPTRAGYTFKGWYSGSGGTGSMVIGTDGKLQANVSGYTGANGIWIATASKTLYAKWTPHTYYVKFNGNGSTSGSMSDQTFTYGTAQTLTANAFEKTGYNFAGWATTANGNVVYLDKQSVSNLTATNGETINLYAKWEAKQITITWDPNGGSVTPTSSSYTYDGAAVTLPTPTRTGYTFNGWFTAASGGTKITEVGTTNKPTANVTYYAQWTHITYTVKWSVDGSITTETVNHGSKPTKIPDTSTPSCGDKFVGWTTEEYKGDTQPDPLYTNEEIPTITEPITFYAVFADYAD